MAFIIWEVRTTEQSVQGVGRASLGNGDGGGVLSHLGDNISPHGGLEQDLETAPAVSAMFEDPATNDVCSTGVSTVHLGPLEGPHTWCGMLKF